MSYDLDHVAIALRDVTGPLAVLVGELGGTVLGGGDAAGFRAMQVRLGDGGDGMTVELLEPWNRAQSEFLERFLAKHGEGLHHLTFKVPDLAGELERLQDLGFDPVGVNLANPMWREAFLPPSQAGGTVVQIAQPGWEQPPMEELLPLARRGDTTWGTPWWREPPSRAARAAVLERVVVATPSLDDAARLFGEVLGGAPDGEGAGRRGFRWPGGRVLVEEGPEVPAGIDRLELAWVEEVTRCIGGAEFRFRAW